MSKTANPTGLVFHAYIFALVALVALIASPTIALIPLVLGFALLVTL